MNNKALLTCIMALTCPFASGRELLTVDPYATGYYEAHMQSYPANWIAARLPLDWMNHQLRKSLEEIGSNSEDIGFKVKKAELDQFSVGSPIVRLTAIIDGKLKGTIDFACDVEASFAIPAAPPREAKLQSLGSSSKCGTSGDLWKPLELNERLAGIIRSALERSLNKALLDQATQENITLWSSQDPLWGELIAKSKVQMTYCSSSRWPRGLCVIIGWRSSSLASLIDNLDASVPKAWGPLSLSKTELLARAKEFVDAAPLKPGPVPYPAKNNGGTWDDDDTTIFSGLICAAGIVQGCDAVSASQGADGAFWRSPAQVDVGTNPFTGDQLTGVLNFLIARSSEDPADAKARLVRFLQFVATHRAGIPSAATPPLDYGYKNCSIPDPSDNCLVGAPAWMLLVELAKRHSVLDLIPPDVRDTTTAFGYDPNVLAWEALISPPGYRLHLVSVYLFLANRLGLQNPAYELASMLLATRQSSNPFFLYLLLGRDEHVLNTLQRQCTLQSTSNQFTEWSWERADAELAWKNSMRWDCAFMYGLLALD